MAIKKNFTEADAALLAVMSAEYHKKFRGWDFSCFRNKIKEERLSWNYKRKVLPLLKTADSLLDMGTGGGEFLADLKRLPRHTYATEGYKPNLLIAKRRLDPLGVKVLFFKSDRSLPFKDEEFDLIINRHESYCPAEIFRLLKNKGIFVTQQVGGQDNLDLNRALGAKDDFGFSHWDLGYAAKELKRSGFEILFCREEFPKITFHDINALVYYLKAVPWQIEDFSVKKYFVPLKKLHHRIKRERGVSFKSHRFIIVARKTR